MAKNIPTYPIGELLSIMAKLRDKESGCPWDIEQDFASIAPHTIEEAYEVADAIARNDKENLKEELGDLLLQVVFHAQMASEENSFTFEDVVSAIAHKLIVRHPHVFGDTTITTADEQTKHWEELKDAERQKKADDDNHVASVLDNVALALPALLRAAKIQKRAARVGFDWEHVASVFDKLEEEITECKDAMANESHDEIEAEVGDMLFTIAHIANRLGVDPENALRRTNQKFETRFRYIEEVLHQQNRSIKESTLKEMDALWDEAKAKESA